MSDRERIELLDRRVRELQTAVVALVEHLGLAQELAAIEQAELDARRLEGRPEAPVERLIELYSTRRPGPPAAG